MRIIDRLLFPCAVGAVVLVFWFHQGFQVLRGIAETLGAAFP